MSAYPPINALRAFEAAIRLNSFSRAADELHVTPGAIGQQIRKLEDWLGVELFARGIRQVRPTADGLEYVARIRPALAQIVDASQQLRARKDRAVRVAMPPSFAAKWFSKRMSQFMIGHPATSLQVSSSIHIVDFSRDAVDIAIRYFNGDADDLECTLLLRGQAAAFCSPEYRDRLGIEKPADLMRATLLNDALHDWWDDWLVAFAGVDRAQCASVVSIELDQSAMAIESAIHGQGVALTIPLLARNDVADGKLIALFPDHVFDVPTGYYLVHPKNTELRGQVREFRDWLMSEAREIAN